MWPKDHIKQLIVYYTRRLQKLEQQQSLHGLATPLRILVKVAYRKSVAEKWLDGTRLGPGLSLKIGETIGLKSFYWRSRGKYNELSCSDYGCRYGQPYEI